MREDNNTILIVEDQILNRRILRNMIQNDYDVLEAENGAEALNILQNYSEEITAILLDIVMPVMDGYEFLKRIKETPWKDIPIIVMTGDNDADTEEKALELGAWDFVIKPYKARILLTRLKNAIARSKMGYLKRIKHMAEHDSVTGLYNRRYFFIKTEEMLRHNLDQTFTFIRMDIKRFRLINSYRGEEGGNRILRFLAEVIRELSHTYQYCTYGRIESDIFGLCIPYEEDRYKELLHKAIDKIFSYSNTFILEPAFGVYVIEDNTMSIENMFLRATAASNLTKNNYMNHIGIYNDALGKQILQEQEVFNDMCSALENEEFEIYFQPKYNVDTQLPCGAEALIRWRHPEKGMITPDIFIPVFEKNGFIEKMDYYVWEKTCQYLRKWIDEGLNPAPVSVNMSRIDCSNTNLPESIECLIKKYDIPPELLQLELTESAYMDNPAFVNYMICELRKRGFQIMIDDFGSGFSSLNTLKDIQVDYLKIDMRFLFSDDSDLKSKKILSSVVSMARWLQLNVIAEGVETKEQFEFLKSIHCDYIQGYYFAKPMPVKEYETKILPLCINRNDNSSITKENEDVYIRPVFLSADIFEKIYTDELTQVYNRRYLKEWLFLNPFTNSEQIKSFTLVLIDIQNFKEINDTMGHLCGDIILKEVAKVLKESVRHQDSVIRYGGDEFLIIFLNCPEEKVYERTAYIQRMLSDISCKENKNHTIGADFGVAHTTCFEKTGEFMEKIIRQADTLMYQNKKAEKEKKRVLLECADKQS